MFTTIRNMITGLFPDVWPIIIIITVIACSLRIAYIVKHKHKFCLYKELSMLIFILYVMCLFEIVTLQDNNYGLSEEQMKSKFDEAALKAENTYWLADGVHPTAMGHELIKKEWLKAFEGLQV